MEEMHFTVISSKNGFFVRNDDLGSVLDESQIKCFARIFGQYAHDHEEAICSINKAQAEANHHKLELFDIDPMAPGAQRI